MGIFKVVRDSYTLAQGWQKWATGKQPWKDSLEMMKRQGFEQEDSLIGFCGNETRIFLNDEVASSGVDDSHTRFKGIRKLPKRPFRSKSCSEAQSRQWAITKGFDDGYKIRVGA
jgi:hypothetical protein